MVKKNENVKAGEIKQNGAIRPIGPRTATSATATAAINTALPTSAVNGARNVPSKSSTVAPSGATQNGSQHLKKSTSNPPSIPNNKAIGSTNTKTTPAPAPPNTNGQPKNGVLFNLATNSNNNIAHNIVNNPTTNGKIPAKTQVTNGGSTPLVDLSKLRKSSLKRYKRHFGLDVKSNPSKAELVSVVAAHFANMPVEEKDVIGKFHKFTQQTRKLGEENEQK